MYIFVQKYFTQIVHFGIDNNKPNLNLDFYQHLYILLYIHFCIRFSLFISPTTYYFVLWLYNKNKVIAIYYLYLDVNAYNLYHFL